MMKSATPKFERATKTDVHYTGTINGKTWVVPHSFHEASRGSKIIPMHHSTVVSPVHVHHNNPTLTPEEMARVHSHIKDIHGGQQLKEGKNMNTFDYHQTQIAKKTLRMPDAMVGVMGGPNKDESRKHLKKMGWADEQIHKHEHGQFALNEVRENTFKPKKELFVPFSKSLEIAKTNTQKKDKKDNEMKNLKERMLTPSENAKKEELVHHMKKNLQSFKDRYGKDAKSIMYATATKNAKRLAEGTSHSLQHIEDKTSILPHVVGRTVAERRGLKGVEAEKFAQHVADRTVHLYNHNTTFKKKLHGAGNKGRDHLYMFANHWLDAKSHLKEGAEHNPPMSILHPEKWHQALKDTRENHPTLGERTPEFRKHLSLKYKELGGKTTLREGQLDELKMPKLGFAGKLFGVTPRSVVKRVHGMSHHELLSLHKQNEKEKQPTGSPAHLQARAIKKELARRGSPGHHTMDKSKFVKSNLHESQLDEAHMKEAPPFHGKENEFPQGTTDKEKLAHHERRIQQYQHSPNTSDASRKAKNWHITQAQKIFKGMDEGVEQLDEAANFMTTYRRNESQNRHTANLVHLAKHFGDAGDQAKAKFYADELKKHGHNIHHEAQYELHKKLWPRAVASHTSRDYKEGYEPIHSTKDTVRSVLREMFTRKHFRQVADVIKAHPDAAKRHELATHHAEIFAKQNPRFDHKRFFSAANAGEPVKEEVEPLTEEKRAVVTKRNPDGSYDEAGMRNRAVVSHLNTEHGIRRWAKQYAKGPHRIEYFDSNMYIKPSKVEHHDGVKEYE
jgi:hypothetical protein